MTVSTILEKKVPSECLHPFPPPPPPPPSLSLSHNILGHAVYVGPFLLGRLTGCPNPPLFDEMIDVDFCPTRGPCITFSSRGPPLFFFLSPFPKYSSPLFPRRFFFLPLSAPFRALNVNVWTRRHAVMGDGGAFHKLHKTDRTPSPPQPSFPHLDNFLFGQGRTGILGRQTRLNKAQTIKLPREYLFVPITPSFAVLSPACCLVLSR